MLANLLARPNLDVRPSCSLSSVVDVVVNPPPPKGRGYVGRKLGSRQNDTLFGKIKCEAIL